MFLCFRFAGHGASEMQTAAATPVVWQHERSLGARKSVHCAYLCKLYTSVFICCTRDQGSVPASTSLASLDGRVDA